MFEQYVKRYPNTACQSIRFCKDYWKQATYHLDKVITIGRENPDIFWLIKALIVKGKVYFLQQQFAEVIPYYQEATDLSSI